MAIALQVSGYRHSYLPTFYPQVIFTLFNLQKPQNRIILCAVFQTTQYMGLKKRIDVGNDLTNTLLVSTY